MLNFYYPNTSVMCSDEVKQYYGAERTFFNKIIHKSTNHSKGERGVLKLIGVIPLMIQKIKISN